MATPSFWQSHHQQGVMVSPGEKERNGFPWYLQRGESDKVLFCGLGIVGKLKESIIRKRYHQRDVLELSHI